LFYQEVNMKLSDNKATLSFSNGSPSIDMPVYSGNIGPDVIDIRKLYGQTGMFTYDPGFLSTASCQSGITLTPATCCSRANCPTAPSVQTSTSWSATTPW
jgi:hypothetical protein